MYSLKIKNLDGDYVEEITAWNDFSYWWELNRAGGCTVAFNIDDTKFDLDNFFPARHFIDIFRNNSKIWSGIYTVANGNIDDITGILTAKFEGYLWLLKKMFISPSGKTFTSEDMGTILWTLIDDFQNLPNGDYGLTSGSISTGIDKDRTYAPFKNVYDAFLQMSEVQNGADFEITEDKVLNVYTSQGKRLNHVFEYGKNIERITGFNINANDLVNNAYAIGSGEGDDLLYSVAHDVQSQELYGLMQDTRLHSDVVLIDTLTEHAKNWVDEYRNMVEIYALDVKASPDPTLKSYGIGDEIRVVINKGYLNIDTYKRIKKLTVSVNSEGKETVSVEFL